MEEGTAEEGLQEEANVCLILDHTLFQHPSILSIPGKVIGFVCVSAL